MGGSMRFVWGVVIFLGVAVSGSMAEPTATRTPTNTRTPTKTRTPTNTHTPSQTPTAFPITLNPLVSHNMVLQKGPATLINGTAPAGSLIEIRWPCECSSDPCTECEGSPTEDNTFNDTASLLDGTWVVALKVPEATVLSEGNEAGQRMRITVGGADNCENIGPFAQHPGGSYYKGYVRDSDHKCVIDIDGVLVGQVWMCAGQSNLSLSFVGSSGNQASEDGDDVGSSEEQAAIFPFIRTSAGKTDHGDAASFPDYGAPPLVKSSGAAGWSESTGTPHDVIALGCWSFAVQLHERLHEPIGIIERSHSATSIRHWEGFGFCDSSSVDHTFMTNEGFDAWDGHQSCDEEAPGYFNWGDDYKKQILPLWPCTIEGIFWWQGQEDLRGAIQPEIYSHALPALVRSWRSDRKEKCEQLGCELEDDEMYFVWPELPKGRNIMNHQARFLVETEPDHADGTNQWAFLPTPVHPETSSTHNMEDRMRAAYMAAHYGNSGSLIAPATTPTVRPIIPAKNAYQVITSDLDAAEQDLLAGDPHPGVGGSHPNDQALYGERVAWVALSQIYKKAWNAAWSGPYLERLLVSGNTARLIFRPGTSNGMVGFMNPAWCKNPPGPLHGFACYDGEWKLPTSAMVCGDQMEVTCPTPPPTPGRALLALRYNRSDVNDGGDKIPPFGNVFNGDSMAMMPFIVDWENRTPGTSPTPTFAACAPTPTPMVACPGSCSNDLQVDADDLKKVMQFALGSVDTTDCDNAEVQENGSVLVSDLRADVAGVLIATASYLQGCSVCQRPVPVPAVAPKRAPTTITISGFRTLRGGVKKFNIKMDGSAQAISGDLVYPTSVFSKIECSRNTSTIKSYLPNFEDTVVSHPPSTPAGHALRQATPISCVTDDDKPASCVRTMMLLDQPALSVQASIRSVFLRCMATVSREIDAAGTFAHGIDMKNATVVDAEGRVSHPQVIPAKVRVSNQLAPVRASLADPFGADAAKVNQYMFEDMAALGEARSLGASQGDDFADTPSEEELEPEDDVEPLPWGGGGCAMMPQGGAREWLFLTAIPIAAAFVRRRRKARLIAMLCALVLCRATVSSADSGLPFFAGGFARLRAGTPDPRITDNVDDTDVGEDQAWDVSDIEPYGAAQAVAELSVVGSSFVSTGTLDIALGSDGIVLGEIYLSPDGDWVAHLEGELVPNGIEAYVLAANGEIDQIYLFAPGLAYALALGIETPTSTATPTETPEGDTPTPGSGDTSTPTNTPPPTATRTPSDTPTPLPTVTPTPTPPEECSYFVMTPTQEYFTLASAQDGPLQPLWCSNDYPLLPVMNLTDDMSTSATTVESHVILRWDTSEIPGSLTAVQAWLRLKVDSAEASSSTEAADRSLNADWYSGSHDFCVPSDYEHGSATALSTDGECGERCDLNNVIIGMTNDFALDSPYEIDAGSVALRLWVPNGGSPVANHLLAETSGGGRVGPQLVVLACDRPPTPSPTPTATNTPRRRRLPAHRRESQLRR